MIIESFSPEDTFMLGKKLGEKARKGEIYTLQGDLGTGKTVFTQGFAAGLGIKEPVNSPTFTIVQEYYEGRLPFFHFDAYRIEEPEEMEEIGCDDYFFGEGICMIEWPERILELLPEDCIRIAIKKDPMRGFDYREIAIRSLVGQEKENNLK